jgi:hypothetical protein
VDDVNEKPVVSNMRMSVGENAVGGTNVGTPVNARDEDVDRSDSVQTLSYSLLNTSLPFTINAVSGQVSVLGTRPLNFERQSVYIAVVVVTDNGVPVQSSNATLTINVLYVLPSRHGVMCCLCLTGAVTLSQG